MSNTLNCGAECGVTAFGGASVATKRHWYPNNTVAIDTSVYRSGTRSFRLDAAASAPSLDHTFYTATDTIVAGIFFFRSSTATPGATARILAITMGGGTCRFDITTGGVLQMNLGAGAGSGPTIVADTWYGVEFEMDVSANPWTGRWRTWDAGTWTDRTAPTTRALAASTVSSVRMDNSGNTSGITVYFDDMSFGTSTAAGTDYASTAREVKVLRYRPNADGTHSFNAGDFGYNGAGSDVATNATDVYSYLDDDDQSGLTDFIRQKVINASGYIEVGFEDESTQTVPRGVTVFHVHHSSSTSTNACTMKVSDDSFVSSTDTWAADDVSDTTYTQRGRTIAPPSGGSWTQAKVNSMKARWGYASDVTDIPYLDSVSLEVAWEVQPAGSDPMGMAGFFGV